MKTILLLCLLFLFKPIGNLNAFGCSIGTIRSQADLDNFFRDNSLCEEIDGRLYIKFGGGEDDVNDLSGLKRIKRIKGDLSLTGKFLESDLSGLSNLEIIEGSLLLEDLSGLDNLRGLTNLKTVLGAIEISNTSFTSLDGLENIKTISYAIDIFDNKLLTSIKALNNQISFIEPIPGVYFYNNPKLEFCNTDFICSLDTSKLSVIFENNGTGCNSYAEVKDACIQSSIEEKQSTNNSIEYISERQIRLNYNLSDMYYTLVNYLGQDVTEQTTLNNGVIDLESLKHGLYFLIINDKSIKLYLI